MSQPRRSRSDWQALVRDWRASQLSAAQFARRRRLDPRRLRWWAWCLRQAEAAPTPTDLLSFVELPATAPRADNDADRVELVLANARRLHFATTIDVDRLARIVAALDGRAP